MPAEAGALQTSVDVPDRAVAAAMRERIGWGPGDQSSGFGFVSCSKLFLGGGGLLPFWPGIPQPQILVGTCLPLGPVNSTLNVSCHHTSKKTLTLGPSPSSLALSHSSRHCHKNENQV